MKNRWGVLNNTHKLRCMGIRFIDEPVDNETDAGNGNGNDEIAEVTSDPRDETITQLTATIASLTKENAGLRAANAAMLRAMPGDTTTDTDEVDESAIADDEPDLDALLKGE